MIGWRTIVTGAASGLVSAVLTDLNAWGHSTGEETGKKAPFSWGLAFRRWVVGAISGAMAAMGVSSV